MRVIKVGDVYYDTTLSNYNSDKYDIFEITNLTSTDFDYSVLDTNHQFMMSFKGTGEIMYIVNGLSSGKVKFYPGYKLEKDIKQWLDT